MSSSPSSPAPPPRLSLVDELRARIVQRESRPEAQWSRQVGPRGYSGATGLLPFPHMLNGLHVSDADVAQCEAMGSPPDWMCRKFAPNYANLHIVGLQKAGTSQLYRMLVHHSHGEAAAANQVKELCPTAKEYSGTRRFARFGSLWPAHNMSTKGGITVWEMDDANAAKYLAYFRPPSPGKITVNGCPDDERNLVCVHRCIAPHMERPPKYLVVLREPAELLYDVWDSNHDSNRGSTRA